MSEFSVGDGPGVEHSPLRVRFGSRIRICIHCGSKTKREVKNCEKPFKHIKQVYRFYCANCNKETSPITQIDYEDNEKRLSKIYGRLLQYAKPEQIKKVWIDSNNNILDSATNIEKLQKISFFIAIGKKEFIIPCSYTKRLTKYYESPIGIKKDKSAKRALRELKKSVDELGK